MAGPEMSGSTPGDFKIVGTNDLLASSEFSGGTNKITSGRAIQSSDEGTNNVVIEKSLAKQNNLKVNSTFTLKDSNDKTYKMTVVGLYKSGSTENDLAADFSFMNPANQMYTALSVPNQIDGKTGTLEVQFLIWKTQKIQRSLSKKLPSLSIQINLKYSLMMLFTNKCYNL